jgi:hypothetical protein
MSFCLVIKFSRRQNVLSVCQNHHYIKITAFWDIAPYSLVKVDRSALMMEAVRICETSATFYETTRRNIPEVCHLHTRCRENLKSHRYCRVIFERPLS